MSGWGRMRAPINLTDDEADRLVALLLATDAPWVASVIAKIHASGEPHDLSRPPASGFDLRYMPDVSGPPDTGS